MKYVILVGDGMGDLPVPALDGLTLLETAATPAMDYIAGHGELFRLRTIPPGYPPGSDVANLSLLGYRPEECYTGRAPLEAASMGVALGTDEIACRCNLVTLREENSGMIMADYSAGHISTSEAARIINDLERELGSDLLTFHPGVSYRHLLVYRGNLQGLNTVPPHDHIDKDVSDHWKAYQDFPKLAVVMSRAREILADHPVNTQRRAKGLNEANGIWIWGEGRSPEMTSIPDQYGISGSLISAVDLLKGIGVYGGLTIINVPGATGYLDTNYKGKADAALAALAEKDLVFVHVEAPDEAGHQGLLREKIQAIEDFDAKIVSPILDGMIASEAEFRLAVAMDHYTPIILKTHVDYPVPIAVYDSRNKRPDSGVRYTEKHGEESETLLESGRDFMEKFLERKAGGRSEE